LNILSDLVVEVVHGIPRVTHPVIAQTVWALSLVPQVRISEAPERMIPCFMRPGMRVYELQLLERGMKVPADNVRGRNRFSTPTRKQEPGLSLPDVLPEQAGDCRVKIHVSHRAGRFESGFNLAMARLLSNMDRQKIG